MLPRLLSVTALVATLGCSDSTEPGTHLERHVGFIGVVGDPYSQPLIVPDSVRIGHPAAITVTTYGSSICIRTAGAEVTRLGSALVEIVPYDSVPPPQTLCSQDEAPHPRAVLMMVGTDDLVIRLIAEAYVIEEGRRRLDTLEAKLRVYDPARP